MKSVAIVQYEDRNDYALSALISRNSIYCQKHQYQHIFIQRVSEDIPPWWIKCFILREVFKQGFEVVVWLDSDAVVHDQDRQVESLSLGEEGLVFAADPPAWSNPSPFNAGVMIFKTGSRVQEMMEKWTRLFDMNKWKKQDGEWHTEGAWAGENYEQGAFVKKLLPEYSANNLLVEVDWKVLQSPWVTSESFTLHFANRTRPNAVFYLKLLEEYNFTHGIRVEKKVSMGLNQLVTR